MANTISITTYDSTSVTVHVADSSTSDPVANIKAYIKEGTVWSGTKSAGVATTDANGDATVTGLIPGDTYSAWLYPGIGGSQFTTPANDLKIPTAAQWQDLATRVKNAGGGPTVVQTTGTSQTDVMSQNATTSMVFADPSTTTRIRIGSGSNAGTDSVGIGKNASGHMTGCVAVGRNADAHNQYTMAIGAQSSAVNQGAIAFGAYSYASHDGEMNIGSSSTTYGYNNTNYRLLSGVHDPQNAHDAATKGYVDSVAPVITMTDTDPGEGGVLAANNFIAVYSAS